MRLVFFASLCLTPDALVIQTRLGNLGEESYAWDPIAPWERKERRLYEHAERHFKPSQELLDAWGRQWDALHEDDKGLERVPRSHRRQAAVDACTSLLLQSDFDYDVLNATDQALAHCADPWFAQKDCSQPFTFPLYRLGDTVMYANPDRRDTTGLKRLARRFPDSIGRKFLERIRKYGKEGMDNLMPLYKVINGKEYSNHERPGPNDVAVHVRAGDVSWIGFDNGADPAHNHWETPCKQFGSATSHACANGMAKSKPEWKEEMKKVDWTNVTRVVLVSGDHKHPETNLTQNEKFGHSKAYLEKVEALIREETGVQNIETRFNFNPDCDFIFLSNAVPERYMKSGGNYDKMIYQMVLNKAAGLDGK